VVLVVALGGADAASVLPRLKEAMFYADLDEALADVPPIDRGMIGFRVERPAGAESSPGTGAETRPGRRGAAQRVCPADPSSFRQPKVMHSVDPEFSEEARRAKISGNVTVGFTVDTDGSTTDLWIIRPMGYGLDEQAAKAVRRYEFEPATCAGEPVASSLLIEVNFQIFR
jgi:protein TonB